MGRLSNVCFCNWGWFVVGVMWRRCCRLWDAGSVGVEFADDFWLGCLFLRMFCENCYCNWRASAVH